VGLGLWRSVLLVEKTIVSGENHRPAPSHWQTLSSTHRLSGIRITSLHVLNIGYINHTITLWLYNYWICHKNSTNLSFLAIKYEQTVLIRLTTVVKHLLMKINQNYGLILEQTFLMADLHTTKQKTILNWTIKNIHD